MQFLLISVVSHIANPSRTCFRVTELFRQHGWRRGLRSSQCHPVRSHQHIHCFPLSREKKCSRIPQNYKASNAPCLYVRPQFRPWENQREKGEGPLEGERGRVPGRRSTCCGFPEVLGFSRAQQQVMNIGIRELKMTAWSFQTSLTKWDPVTRSGS